MTAIECSELSRQASRGREDAVLRDLSLEIPEGARVGLLGGNGAGKSTLFKLLLGLAPIARGEARIFGKAVPHRASRVGIGYLPEQASCFDELTGREYLDLYARLEGLSRNEGRRRIDELIEGMGLGDAADSATRAYSKGMLQKLELARVLLRPRRLLLLDEPLSGLDVEAKLALEERIAELSTTAVTMVISSHEPHIFDALCTHFILLRKGKLMRFGARDELLPTRGWRLEFDEGRSLDFEDRAGALGALRNHPDREKLLNFGPIRERTDDLLREVSHHG